MQSLSQHKGPQLRPCEGPSVSKCVTSRCRSSTVRCSVHSTAMQTTTAETNIHSLHTVLRPQPAAACSRTSNSSTSSSSSSRHSSSRQPDRCSWPLNISSRQGTSSRRSSRLHAASSTKIAVTSPPPAPPTPPADDKIWVPFKVSARCKRSDVAVWCCCGVFPDTPTCPLPAPGCRQRWPHQTACRCSWCLRKGSGRGMHHVQSLVTVAAGRMHEPLCLKSCPLLRCCRCCCGWVRCSLPLRETHCAMFLFSLSILQPDFFSSQPVQICGSFNDWSEPIQLDHDPATGKVGGVVQLDAKHGVSYRLQFKERG